MNLQEIKREIDIIYNTKDIENIEKILAYNDLGKRIKKVLRAVQKMNNRLDFANQQFIGYYQGKWTNLEGMIKSMNLTEAEWKILKKDYLPTLDKKDHEEIEMYFKEKAQKC
jgi:hypothetical protein